MQPSWGKPVRDLCRFLKRGLCSPPDGSTFIEKQELPRLPRVPRAKRDAAVRALRGCIAVSAIGTDRAGLWGLRGF